MVPTPECLTGTLRIPQQSTKTPNEEESSIKSGEEDSYCDIGSSQAINATHVLAELGSMRLTIFVVVSNKEQGMDHFVQQCLK